VPILVEGSTDSAILLNVATKIELPLGAAGIGVAALGGKRQLFAFRALLASLVKSEARFILDLDAAVDANVLHTLDADPSVVSHLAAAGSGGRTLSQESGELIRLLREYLAKLHAKGESLGPLRPQSQARNEKDLAVALRVLQETVETTPAQVSDLQAAKVILGKLELIRAAARTARA
jgi:hypothetical protein